MHLYNWFRVGPVAELFGNSINIVAAYISEHV